MSREHEKLDLNEKIALLTGRDHWSTQPVGDLPSIILADGPHGVRYFQPGRTVATNTRLMTVIANLNAENGSTELLKKVTCFPTFAGVGSTWDRDLIQEVGVAVASECMDLGVGVLCAPGINIKRHPLTGRNYEYLSEDPVLTGELAAAYIRGVQSQGVGATVKHYACNNAEFERTTMDSVVEERALREIYLAAFERAVKKGNPWLVMTSYNRVNGEDASHNHRLLTEILRDEWGFDGVIVSDWFGVKDRARSLTAGLDLEMPRNPRSSAILLEAVQSGQIDEAIVDRSVRRIANLVGRCSESPGSREAVDLEAQHAFARRVASESIVLLKNDGAILPIDAGPGLRVGVVGTLAKKPRYQGGGSSLVNPYRLTNALDALKDSGCDVSFGEGYLPDGSSDPNLLDEARDIARKCDVVLVFAGLPGHAEMESVDREHMHMPGGHEQLIRAVANVQDNTVVVLVNGSVVSMVPWVDDVPAILETWLGGQAGGEAVVDVLLGRVNPGAKLPVTIPRRLEDTPAFLDFPGESHRHPYSEGIFVGYRYYETRKIPVLFPFGHGLSYTRFTYSDLRVESKRFMEHEGLSLSVVIENGGSMRGKEVVQVYVRDRVSRLRRPVKELKGFEKVGLDPGEQRRLSFHLDARDFSYYDPELERWVAESGLFDILVGSSSEDIRLSAEVELLSGQNNFIPLSKESYTHEILRNSTSAKMFADFLKENDMLPPDFDESRIDELKLIYLQVFKLMECYDNIEITPDQQDELFRRINKMILEDGKG